MTLRESGRYLGMIDHGNASEDVLLEVWTTIRLVGIQPAWFLGGFVLLGISRQH